MNINDLENYRWLLMTKDHQRVLKNIKLQYIFCKLLADIDLMFFFMLDFWTHFLLRY